MDTDPVTVGEQVDRWEQMRQEERAEQLAQIARDVDQAERLAAALAPQRE